VFPGRGCLHLPGQADHPRNRFSLGGICICGYQDLGMAARLTKLRRQEKLLVQPFTRPDARVVDAYVAGLLAGDLDQVGQQVQDSNWLFHVKDKDFSWMTCGALRAFLRLGDRRTAALLAWVVDGIPASAAGIRDHAVMIVSSSAANRQGAF
jgi:hypothetical protein